jgi:hypothetical protein
MKKFLMIILLLLVVSLPLSFSEASYSALTSELDAMEFIEETQITEAEGHLYIQMNVTFQDEKMIYYYQDIIEKVYLQAPAKSITLLIYSEGFPVFRIQSIQGDIEDYIDGTIDRNEFLEQMGIEDIRSIENVLYDELNLFDAYIIGIFVDESESRVQLESMKKPESFQDDFMAMALTVIENTPWIDTVVFEFFKDEEEIMTIKGNKDAFLKAMKGTMSEEDFVKSLEVDIPDDIKKENEDNKDNKTVNNSKEGSTDDKGYIIIDVASGSINEVISGSKIFKLDVPEGNEYYFKINNFETLKTELIIKDGNNQLVDDNIRDGEVIEYIYADLEEGEDYYLEVKPLQNMNEAVDIRIETSSSIIPFLLGILVMLSGVIFVIIKLIKKIKSKK